MKKVFTLTSYLVIFVGIIFLIIALRGDIFSNKLFSTNIRGLSNVVPTEIIELKDGDIFNLEAKIVKKIINGSEVKMLAYNGMIPGPTLKVAQGSEITLNFINNTDVDSTIHSHGIRLENKFDGVPNVTQEAVKSGESFTYKIKFPDGGIYWYHPHVREDYAQELGLYGNFIVTPAEEDYWAKVDREEILFLDDILMKDNQIESFSKSTVDHTLMGRFGNVMLVNGDDDYSLLVKQGESVRFYITNSANTRVFNFAIPNIRMKLVGADSGKFEREEWVDSVILGPSERTVVEVLFNKDGNYQIINQTPNRAYKLGSINVESSLTPNSYSLTPRINKDLIDSLSSLRPFFLRKSDKNLRITMEMGNQMQNMMQGQSNTSSSNGGQGSHMMPDGSMMSNNSMMPMSNREPIEWEDTDGMMNMMSDNSMLGWSLLDEDTGRKNEDIDNWKFKVGDKIKITIFNDPNSMHPMQHPIHFHGQRFLILSRDGVINNNQAWKDTVLVKKGEKVDILLDITNPGDWMAHCHIPEHMESGMMFSYEVI